MVEVVKSNGTYSYKFTSNKFAYVILYRNCNYFQKYPLSSAPTLTFNKPDEIYYLFANERSCEDGVVDPDNDEIVAVGSRRYSRLPALPGSKPENSEKDDSSDSDQGDKKPHSCRCDCETTVNMINESITGVSTQISTLSGLLGKLNEDCTSLRDNYNLLQCSMDNQQELLKEHNEQSSDLASFSRSALRQIIDRIDEAHSIELQHANRLEDIVVHSLDSFKVSLDNCTNTLNRVSVNYYNTTNELMAKCDSLNYDVYAIKQHSSKMYCLFGSVTFILILLVILLIYSRRRSSL